MRTRANALIAKEQGKPMDLRPDQVTPIAKCPLAAVSCYSVSVMVGRLADSTRWEPPRSEMMRGGGFAFGLRTFVLEDPEGPQ